MCCGVCGGKGKMGVVGGVEFEVEARSSVCGLESEVVLRLNQS